MNHYDDTPDTTVFYEPIPAGSGPGVSYSRCGCVLPASCPACRGDLIGGAAAAVAAASWTYEGWVQAMREKAAREAGGAA